MKSSHVTRILVSTLTLFPFTVSCSSDANPGGNGTGGSATGGALIGDGSGGATGGTPGMSTGGSATGGSTGLGTGGSATGGATGGSATGGDGSGGDGTGGEMGTGGSDPVGSSGCGMDAGQSLNAWGVQSASGRNYDVKLPTNYDSMRAYPVILQLHGCGSPTNNVPIDNVTGEDAIIIRGQGSDGTCWDVDGDLTYVDNMIAHVQDNFCVNPDALFAVGYSSGSWLASRLSCARADVFRGIGTVTGGWPGGSSTCNGQVGRIFVHDANDNDNQLAWDTPGRDIMIANNNCDNSTTPVNPSPCVSYNNCDEGQPVVWCQTSGKGHSRQDELAPAAFWTFFQSLIDE